jgi:HAD superfamily hydrolase (TIGR01509 family)
MAYYLFDFDGTLVDSMPTFVSVMTRILDENGIPHGDDLIKIITPLGYAGTANYYITLGLKMEKEDIIALAGRYAYDDYANRIEAKATVIDTLTILKARGDLLNVLTASPHAVLDPCLKRIGIYALFDNVWSCDDFATSKSDPAIYEMAARRMGVAVDRVLFLDDNYNADKTAAAAGMKVCGVYDDSSADYIDDIKAVTDFYIHRFGELPPITW